MHIANIFVKCAHLSLFCPKTHKPSCCVFPVPRDPIQAFPGWEALPSQNSLWQLVACTGLTPALAHARFSSCLPSAAAWQWCPDTTTIPEGTAALLLPFVGAHSRARKDKTTLNEFVGIPAPVHGIMGSKDRKAGSLQVSGYSCTQGKLKGLVRWTLFNSSPLHGPSGTPRNLKLNSEPYFN